MEAVRILTKIHQVVRSDTNVGPSLPQPPNLTSLRKLQYTSARTNVHAT